MDGNARKFDTTDFSGTRSAGNKIKGELDGSSSDVDNRVLSASRAYQINWGSQEFLHSTPWNYQYYWPPSHPRLPHLVYGHF